MVQHNAPQWSPPLGGCTRIVSFGSRRRWSRDVARRWARGDGGHPSRLLTNKNAPQWSRCLAAGARLNRCGRPRRWRAAMELAAGRRGDPRHHHELVRLHDRTAMKSAARRPSKTVRDVARFALYCGPQWNPPLGAGLT